MADTGAELNDKYIEGKTGIIHLLTTLTRRPTDSLITDIGRFLIPIDVAICNACLCALHDKLSYRAHCFVLFLFCSCNLMNIL